VKVQLRTPKDVKALRARIASLPEVRAKIAKRVAEEFSKLAKVDFDAGVSPDGKPWGPGKRGKRVTLKRSGRLEAKATRFVAVGNTVRASALDIFYAKYQLKRSFMPSMKKLPPAWRDRVRAIATEEISKHLRGER